MYMHAVLYYPPHQVDDAREIFDLFANKRAISLIPIEGQSDLILKVPPLELVGKRVILEWIMENISHY